MFESDHDGRTRMVEGAADLMGRCGPSAMTVRQLARHTGAPLGSTYHYFPGGKAQLTAEAVRWADDQTTAELQRSAASGPTAIVDAFLAMWRKLLQDSDFRRGCPVLAVAVAGPAAGDDAASRDAAIFAFSNWTAIITASLREVGVPHAEATDTATLIVAAVEGAVAMGRAERSTDPLDAVGRRLHTLLN